jgi:predicted NUDIX family phosphoesterase
MAQSVFFTADTHFGHRNVINYSKRPFRDIEEMDEALIANWNAVIRPGDLVYHLGDFALCDVERATKIVARLVGQKYLVFGNHDKALRKHKPFLGHWVWQRELTSITVENRCSAVGPAVANFGPVLRPRCMPIRSGDLASRCHPAQLTSRYHGPMEDLVAPHRDKIAEGELFLTRARELHGILRAQARRAFVIELTGTLKAGKSTSVVALQTFFKDAGYRVHLLKERAADCPIPMKGHFYFNAWTTVTMLAEVLETYETNVDLLILDRGFFDALVWLELQARRDQVTPEEKKVFSDFVLLERWRSLVDMTVIMKVEPSVALTREHQNQIVHREGSMMNPRALGEFNNALAHVAERYSQCFPISEIDTTKTQGVVETNLDLLGVLLPRIEAWADPKIAVVPRQAAIDVFGDSSFLHGDDARPALESLAGQVTFRKRSEAEQDKDVVQLLGAGVTAHEDGIMILERELRDKKAMEYGQHALWIGCHVDIDSGDLLGGVATCLVRRIQQELHLATPSEPVFLGLAWDKNQTESQHFGVMFRIPVLNDYVAEHLENKQFKKMGRSGRIKSTFMKQEEIVRALAELDLEPWSYYMARNIKLTQTKDVSV